MAERIYGIDLGTSNSAISYVDSLGVPVIQENLDGDLSTPSVVWFESKANTVKRSSSAPMTSSSW